MIQLSHPSTIRVRLIPYGTYFILMGHRLWAIDFYCMKQNTQRTSHFTDIYSEPICNLKFPIEP